MRENQHKCVKKQNSKAKIAGKKNRDDMFIYLGFIITLEFVLRIVDLLFSKFNLADKEDEEEDD